MSFDGGTEEANIIARLADLAGGRILDAPPDDADIPVDDTGKARPYVVLSVGAPFATAGAGRSMGDGEEDIPYTMTCVVGCYAGDREARNALYKEVSSRLVGWSPNEGNALPLRIPYANSGAYSATQSRPAIYSKIAAMTTIINLSTR